MTVLFIIMHSQKKRPNIEVEVSVILAAGTHIVFITKHQEQNEP